MQVGGINSNNYQTNFTGFRVAGGDKSFNRVMQTFADTDTKDLLKCLHVIKKETKNATPIIIEDIGFHSGQKCTGHWDVTIGDKVYNNGNPLNPRSLVESKSHELKRYSNIAQKDNPNKLSKTEEKIEQQKNKLELMELKRDLKNGADEVQIKDRILDYIFDLLRGKQV